MQTNFILAKILMIIMIMPWALAGCTDADVDSAFKEGQKIIVRVGNRTMTLSEFNRHFESSQMAYPDTRIADPLDLGKAKQLFLMQEIETLILLERAAELGLEISDSELKAAVAEIKKDYPDDTFDQMLIEQAVYYPVWEKQLKERLLIDKVIKEEVEKKIVVTPDEKRKGYERLRKKALNGAKQKKNLGKMDKAMEKKITERLHREKFEKEYQAFLKRLKEKYPIEINKVVWERNALL
jgi:hypothetical protein